jgi:serine/threonine protein kinase
MEDLKQDLEKEFLSKGYLICDKIGEGGNSYVYKAKRMNAEVFVAIKLLKLPAFHSKIAKLELISYFKQSNSIYNSLHHSNIVICFESGELYNGIPYVVFEYISGDSLKQFLIIRRTPSVIATIMTKVLNALAYSHTVGIVHGDLKPHNIMILGSEEDLHVKLIDFGAYESIDGLKSFDVKFRSPMYNSPEQLKGNSPTAQCDLYAWALIFLECLIGTPIISGNSIDELTRNHLSEQEHTIPKEVRKHPLGNLLALALNKKTNRSLLNAQYLVEELSKLDYNTLANCRIYHQKNSRSNIENTILAFPK